VSSHDFLVEIGSEELPPKALKTLSESFTREFTERLNKSGLTFGDVHSFASPRRLAIRVQQLASSQPALEIERRGPSVSAAFDASGKPTKACEGFARSCKTTPQQLEKLTTDKGSWMVYRTTEPGKATVQLLPDLVAQALAVLPFPKKMRWGASRIEFVRPVHWVLMLIDDNVPEATILGIRVSNSSRGHRFHNTGELIIRHPEDYEQLLEKPGCVIADFNKRKKIIQKRIQQLAIPANGQVIIDDDLLNEVTSLTEWPVALMGQFDARFLQVPDQALISTMKSNQKYFHVQDADKNLLPYFVTIANLQSKNPQQVISGNERVIRPRLEDAAFFFETDQKRRLESRINELDSIIFQKQLGNLREKSERVSKLSAKIASVVGSNAEWAERAGKLSKTDLTTEMVLEFPELQGIMGRCYANIDGEAEDVSVALEEQYLPRYAGDKLPHTLTGAALSIADKLDSLVGIFGIDQAPSGTKDPFALRRAALGILRIITEKELDLDLAQCIEWALELYPSFDVSNVQDAVTNYVLERFRAWYEELGIPVEVVQSVMARRPTRPMEFDQRIQAVAAFVKLESAQTLAAANKRVSNILAKEHDVQADHLDENLLHEPLEKMLYQALKQVSAEIQSDLAARNFTQALKKLTVLKTPIDNFFDGIMVMTDNPEIRRNRIALLAEVRAQFLKIADISLLQSKG